MIRTLYPSLVTPPQPQEGPDFNPWLQPWSEPVKQKIKPALAIALIASGLFAPTFTPTIEPGNSYESTYHQPWSEPVRFRRLPTADIPFIVFAPTILTDSIEARWHFPWSEPARFKEGLRAGLQQFTTPLDPIYPILPTTAPWFEPLNEPVRLKPGLLPSLQHYLEFTALKPAALPVTITLNATEINLDVALFGILVYDVIPAPYVLIAGANVTVSEIQATNAGAASIEET